MLFNSISFAVFVLISFLLYWFVFDRLLSKSRYQLKLQNAFVVISSYVFYGWWDWRFLILIFITSLCSWISGILIDDAKGSVRAKFWLWGNILLNLGILFFFKYFNFFISEFSQLFHISSDGLLVKVILPVGISFYTFQALSYSIDVYKGRINPTKDCIAFFAYISFFPQLVAGPIERATSLLPQFLTKRVFSYNKATDGLRQILWGLFKKTVVADNCAIYVNQVFATYTEQSGSTLFLAAILFAFQIYGDFSGYSDIAIGTAKLFGIRLRLNFRCPYFSRDIAEFWRRWHISLTTWFRDYIYIPLGGSRVNKAKIIRNTFIIFLLSGFWHGANWTFIAWGAFHALLFLPLILSGKNRRYTNDVAEGHCLPSIRELGQMILVFLLTVFGWVLFRAESIGQALDYYSCLANASLFSVPWLKAQSYYIPTFASIFVLLGFEWHFRQSEFGFEIQRWPKWSQYLLIYGLCLSIYFFSGSSETFIYFQF